MNMFHYSGKMSVFGGPEDTGVEPDEGLALVEPDDLSDSKWAELFLPENPPDTTGLARRLDPSKYYMAMMWNYSQHSRSLLRQSWAVLMANGRAIIAKPVDQGPAAWTKRVCDMSPGAAQYLGLVTDNLVDIVLITP